MLRQLPTHITLLQRGCDGHTKSHGPISLTGTTIKYPKVHINYSTISGVHRSLLQCSRSQNIPPLAQIQHSDQFSLNSPGQPSDCLQLLGHMVVGTFVINHAILHNGTEVSCMHFHLELKRSGLSLSSVKVHFVTVTAFPHQIEGYSVFTHPTTRGFLKGLGNLFSQIRCPTLTWDLNFVFRCLTRLSFEPMATVPFNTSL